MTKTNTTKISLIALSFAIMQMSANAATESKGVKASKWQQQRFAQLDSDNNGYLNLNELRGTTKQWMNKAGYNEEKQIKLTTKKFNKFDTDKNEQIDLAEFATGLNKEKKRKKKS